MDHVQQYQPAYDPLHIVDAEALSYAHKARELLLRQQRVLPATKACYHRIR